MPSTGPHIPKDVLERLLALSIMKGVRSVALSDSFDAIRLKIISHGMGIDDCPVGGPLRDGAQLTLLQIAAQTGDIPLAYDVIRLGASLDMKNSRGSTALHIAYEEYSRYQQACRISSNTVQSASDALSECLRCREIARVLVEQHATIDVVADDDPLKETVLHAACMLRDWDFIQLLIHHGAREKPNVNGMLPSHHLTPKEKRRLEDIISTAPTVRPPRICPCWSGEILSECHAREPKPFPSEFLCRCRSGRSYKRCCKARNIRRVEFWNAADEWIAPMDSLELPVHLPA
ncbi:hypothetical protein BD410DRAFT_112204 [Rickenella mellea]|uniref:Ankyrin n=1 Tax=Rickenella mellea TaxID=50990 RepID=A0A4Y7Q960_9AGAM|nr:hypothetical protein BD410DRAFT_112204 [Rickenella mellea]